MVLVQSQFDQRHDFFIYSSSPASLGGATPAATPPILPPPPSTTSSGGKLNPVVILILVIMAVIFFISGLLHLLVRYLMKQRSSTSVSYSNRYPESSPGSDAFQRQLQQLFHLHDSGLDQAFIDALPVFMYKEIIGLKEPSDCAVCLCEFSEQDKLRLLPLCSHAFHIDCIDTWLLSNSTCPLCRGALYVPGIQIDNPMFGFDDSREDEDLGGFPVGQKSGQVAISMEKMVFHVRLGKFMGSSNEGKVGRREVGETSSSSLDARRCYSMGSYQYVEANSNLQVTLCPYRGSNIKGRHGLNRNSLIDREAMEGKRINIVSKNESFSVSKIWLWSKKGNFHGSSNTSFDAATVDMNLPWTNRAQFGT
ncbi:hypothetical protein Droror1_Dr00008166 [Drosera rotundifolia]